MSGDEYLEQGIVVSVDEVPAGDALAAPAGPTDLVLSVYDACDFNEQGGQALLVGDASTLLVPYLTADLDLDQLTLLAPLAATWPADTPVMVYPDSRERRALVQLEGEGEGVDARVPHALYDRLALGSRAVDGERVSLTLDGTEWVVQDILGQQPDVDGSFIDPDTLVLPPPTDGVGPTVSPTPSVIGGIGALFVRWVPPVNADPLSYDVHVSPVNGFSPDATTFIEKTPATSITIRKLPTAVGTPPSDALQYGVTYYFRIVATDADGWAPVGAQAGGQMVQVTGPDIAANSVTADHIVAGTITGDLLSANIILASKITTGQVDAFGQIVGQRVELDPNGLRVVSAAGDPIIILPTDPGQAAQFAGQVTAQGLTVTGAAVFQSDQNTVGLGAGITLASTVPNPTQAPNLAAEWATVTLQVVSRSSTWDMGKFGLVPSEVMCMCPSPTAGIYYLAQLRPSGTGYNWGTRVWNYSLATGQNVLENGVYFRDYPSVGFYGMAVVGGRFYAMEQWLGTSYWFVYREDGIEYGTENWYTRLNASEYPTLGHDGTNVIIAENDPTGVLKVRTVGAWVTSGPDTPPGPPAINIASTTTYGAGTAYSSSMCYVGKGNFDFGSQKVVYSKRQSATQTCVVASAAGSPLDLALVFPHPNMRRATMYMLGAFRTFIADGTLIDHTGLTLADGLAQWYAGVTWRDTVGTTHETQLGPMSSIAMVRRARLKVTLPTVPVGGAGVDDPNGWALYMAKVASGTPAAATTRQQATGGAVTLTATISDVSGAGAAPPALNNFAGGGTSGWIKSGAVRTAEQSRPRFQVDGAGAATIDGLIPPGTIVLTAAVAAPPGWLLCDGLAYSRTTYAELYATVLTRYGVGDGSSTFNVPNLKGSVPVGLDAAQTEFNTLGKAGGAKVHALATTELPAHAHNISGGSTAIYVGADINQGIRITTASSTGTVQGLARIQDAVGESGLGPLKITSTGSGAAHNNLQPYQVLNYIIKT